LVESTVKLIICICRYTITDDCDRRQAIAFIEALITSLLLDANRKLKNFYFRLGINMYGG